MSKVKDAQYWQEIAENWKNIAKSWEGLADREQISS